MTVAYTSLTVTALAIMAAMILLGALGVFGKLPGKMQKRVPSFIALGWGLVGLLAILRGWLMFNAI